MKKLLFSTLFSLALTSVFAQPTNAIRRGPPPMTLSPDIEAGRMVTFRLRAPRAQEVSVNGQWPNGRAAMSKDSNSVWSVTVGPVEPGVWEYSFQVDGLTMIDPGNSMIKPMRLPVTSILQIRGEPPLLWDFQDVPHGTVHEHTYFSKSLGRMRAFDVYTPPNYEHEPDKKFPVLYLQHGSGDNQMTWTVHGKANWILDNLIAQGRAEPMIIVMMDGHAVRPGMGTNGPPLDQNTKLFERDLLEDVMPFAEQEYRVKGGAANRAIVGLSMGGGQSLTIGLNHPDLFAWIGGFSSAAPSDDAIASALNDPAINQKLKLLWVGDGKDDFLRKRNEDFIATLKAHNIQYQWHLSEGGHTWPVWRNYLIELTPKLFR
ncbi:MAG TPA: alpha/beta hydrolase-fold protein [Verrucomicrobiae bacterium]|jgi:enterochelin esterase family protein|nr:alpha/beta hydrolase-fold protein [Verrucomicrobiae bacterium]